MNKNYKLLSLITAGIFLFVSFFGMMQTPVKKSFNVSISLVKLTVLSPLSTMGLLNNYILKLSAGVPEAPVAASDTQKPPHGAGGPLKVLFLSLSSIVVSRRLFLVILMISACLCIRYISIKRILNNIFFNKKNYNCQTRYLGFLSPIQKYIEVLKEKYYIGKRIQVIITGTIPALNKLVRGLFYLYKR